MATPTKKKKPALPYANIGCGEFYAEGYVNVDITKEEGGPQPDVVASALDLPFTKDSLERIYAGHVLEHLTLEDVGKALDEFERVLKKDGVLMIVGPDIARAIVNYPEVVESIRHGANRWDGDAQLWESSETKMLEILQLKGWSAAPQDVADPSMLAWPIVSQVGWQYAIAATKLKAEDLPEEVVEKIRAEALEAAAKAKEAEDKAALADEEVNPAEEEVLEGEIVKE